MMVSTLSRRLAMHGVEAFGLGQRQLHHAGGDDTQAGLLEAAIDVADHVLLDAVGLHNRKGAFERHESSSSI